MTGKVTAPMLRAVSLVKAGATVTDAAKFAGVNLQALRKALRRAGVPPRKPGRPARSE